MAIDPRVATMLLTGQFSPGASTEAALAGSFDNVNLGNGDVFALNKALSNGVPAQNLDGFKNFSSAGGPRIVNPDTVAPKPQPAKPIRPTSPSPRPVSVPRDNIGGGQSSFPRPSFANPAGLAQGNVSTNFQKSAVTENFDPNAPLIQNGMINGVPVQNLNELGTQIPPEVQELMAQLTSRGQDLNQRAINSNRLNLGAGDEFNSAAARAEALLTGELNNNLLSTVLGLGANSSEQQRDRVFQERQNLLASAAQKQQLGMQLTVQESIALQQQRLEQQIAREREQAATFRQGRELEQQLNLKQLDIDQIPTQVLLALLGSGNTSSGSSIGTSSGSTSSSGFNFGF